MIDSSELSVPEVVARIVALLPVAPATPLPGDRFWRTVRPVAGPLFNGMLRLSVTGAEHVPRRGPVVFVANHQSLWDIPALGAAQPRAIRYMAKSELFRPRPFGAFLRMGGTFGVHRGQPDREALRTVHETLAGGGTVGVFIQGHRQDGFEEAKAGAGRIAVVEQARRGAGGVAQPQLAAGQPHRGRLRQAPPLRARRPPSCRGLPRDGRPADGRDP